ncbi:hypothetical protein LAZ67_1001681 [Cordylochernes scorpioides]|uniref:Reverse transcriptase domain-containing protein n=1 Tax=Cordylochernes scorpioides TaxID=51811 RepID=A0ABY6JYB3_9ARAC|nr:hypothetical protein LAZ67_1001681 [Cordylochernes scorpioides]
MELPHTSSSTRSTKERPPCQSRTPSIIMDKTPPYPCRYCDVQHWYAQFPQYLRRQLDIKLQGTFELQNKRGLIDFNLLSDRQHGFRRSKSTITALTEIIKIALEHKTREYAAIIAVDISAAFDNAWWPALMKRLDEDGVQASMIKLLQSYFDNRRIRFRYSSTEINKKLSKGCPQGGPLSPTLWNILINEILINNLDDNCETIGYADDITLICWNKTPEQLRKTIDNVLRKINKWCESRSKLIKPVEELKILGVTIKNHRVRSKLDFTPHVNEMIIKVTRAKALEAQILTVTKVEHNILVPNISLATLDTNLPFILKRRQFPLRLALAMTINKVQGQTFDRVGLLLQAPVFTHGYLYWAFSRVRTLDSRKMPPHRLNLKDGAIVMLLINLNPKQALCNGIQTKVGHTVLVPFLSSILKRRQFPLRLAFAMTINKTQDQNFSRVGLLLTRACVYAWTALCGFFTCANFG